RRVDDMACGAHHEHIAETLIEDDLGGHSAIAAAEHDRGGRLRVGQFGSMLDTLAGMLGRTGDESLVTLFECFPGGYRSCAGHGRHCAAPADERARRRASRLVRAIPPR